MSLDAAGAERPGESRRERELRVRHELYSAWIERDTVYAKARAMHQAATALGDERSALAARLEIEDLERSARRFAALVAREQVWGWKAPFVALFSWMSRRG